MAYSPASQKRYNEKNYTFITLKLHNERDWETLKIIDKFVEQGISRQADIKKLISEVERVELKV